MYRAMAASYALIAITYLSFAVSTVLLGHAIYEFYFAFAALDGMMSAVYGFNCRSHDSKKSADAETGEE